MTEKAKVSDTPSDPQLRTGLRVFSWLLLVLGSVAFFFAQSSYWVQSTFFDEATFVGITKEVLSTEESRTAIASTIVESAFEDRPAVEQLVGQQATALVSGFLGTNLASQLFDRVSHEAYAYLTTPDREDIALHIAPVKDVLAKLVNLAEQTGRDVELNPENIPDSIVLVESDSIPNLSGFVRKIIIVGGLMWFVAGAALIGYVYIHRRTLARSLYAVGASLIIASLVGIAVGPFVPPVIASLINLISVRSVVEDLSVALIAPFQTQLLITIAIIAVALILVACSGLIYRGIAKLFSRRAA